MVGHGTHSVPSGKDVKLDAAETVCNIVAARVRSPGLLDCSHCYRNWRALIYVFCFMEEDCETRECGISTHRTNPELGNLEQQTMTRPAAPLQHKHKDLSRTRHGVYCQLALIFC
jgi:hypothetical protein